MTSMKVYKYRDGCYELVKITNDLESLQEVVLNLMGMDVKAEDIIISDGYDLHARFMDRIDAI